MARPWDYRLAIHLSPNFPLNNCLHLMMAASIEVSALASAAAAAVEVDPSPEMFVPALLPVPIEILGLQRGVNDSRHGRMPL